MSNRPKALQDSLNVIEFYKERERRINVVHSRIQEMDSEEILRAMQKLNKEELKNLLSSYLTSLCAENSDHIEKIDKIYHGTQSILHCVKEESMIREIMKYLCFKVSINCFYFLFCWFFVALLFLLWLLVTFCSVCCFSFYCSLVTPMLAFFFHIAFFHINTNKTIE